MGKIYPPPGFSLPLGIGTPPWVPKSLPQMGPRTIESFLRSDVTDWKSYVAGQVHNFTGSMLPKIL